MTNPSFMSYDYRDPRVGWRREEELKWWTKFTLWMVIFLLGATAANNLVSVSSAQEKEPLLTDEQIICKDALLYFAEGRTDIVGYCVGLMNRGL